MTTRSLRVAIHRNGTFAITDQHMLTCAKIETPHVERAMLLPNSRHLDVVSGVLHADHILCLEGEQSHASLTAPNDGELANYQRDIPAIVNHVRRLDAEMTASLAGSVVGSAG